jgi:hypothetical protein
VLQIKVLRDRAFKDKELQLYLVDTTQHEGRTGSYHLTHRSNPHEGVGVGYLDQIR